MAMQFAGSVLGAVMLCAMPAAMVIAVPARAQVLLLDGKSTIGADSASGQSIRIVSANPGGARVSIDTHPDVALICDDKAPRTSCYAWVKTGSVIRVSLRRPAGPRMLPGQGAAPKPGQWGFDCVGTMGPDCTVTMNQARTVFVDWGR
jgi:hypothetical protein